MNRLLTLALNTFREAIRDRVMISILFFAVGSILFSLALEELTIGDYEKVVRSVGQGAIDVFASILAMFLGVSLVWKELEKKTIYTVLSKPIPRWMFVLGKYTGLMATLAVQVALMTVVYTLLMVVRQDGLPPPVVYVSMLTLFLELMLLTAWATLFSCYSAPTTAAAFTLAVFVIGHLADDIWLFGNQSDVESVRATARAVYWALPNFEAFSIRGPAVHHRAIPWQQVGTAAAYGLGYTTAVLGLAVAVFSKRDVR